MSTLQLGAFELGVRLLGQDAECLMLPCLFHVYLPAGAFELTDSACWGKVLKVSCYSACLMSAYQLGGF